MRVPKLECCSGFFGNGLQNLLKGGGKVTLVGFGTFGIYKRLRNGRNPQTGAVIKSKAKKYWPFKAGKELQAKL